jgi:uncharacterized protein YacL
MAHTNWNRVIWGGLLAGLVINVIEYFVNGLLLKDAWARAMQALAKPAGFTTGAIVAFLIWGFLFGIAAVWLYAAIRSRYGAGPNTAIRAGVAAWVLGALLPNLASYTMGLFSTGLLVISTIVALVEFVVGTMAGARVYKEELIAVTPARPAAAA